MSTSRRLGSRSHGKPRRGFSRVAVTAALIVGLLIGAGATYILAGAAPSRTTTVIKTLPVVTGTSTTTATIRQTSTTARVIGANAWTVASNGLRLSTSINATDITVGQNLNISVSLFNTLPTANALEQVGRAGFLPGNWTFYGVPVATWPECTPSVFFFGWQFPIEILVLNGNYTAQQLSSLANVTLSAGPCPGAGGVAIPTYTFEPKSDLINITYFADGGAGFGQVGLFRSSSHFTVGGYWNLTVLQEQANSNINNDYSYDYCISAVLLVCEIPQSIPLVPGEYTIGVTDEWGQFNVVHFQVSESG